MDVSNVCFLIYIAGAGSDAEIKHEHQCNFSSGFIATMYHLLAALPLVLMDTAIQTEEAICKRIYLPDDL